MSHRSSVTAPPVSPGRPRLRRAAGVAAAGLAAAGLTLGLVQPPATGAGATRLTGADLSSFRGLGDTPLAAPSVDLRGTFPVSSRQEAAAGSLGADLTWNDFGTPASILPRDGSLGVASTDPAEAPRSARSWLLAHNEVFGLSDAEINGLELVNNQEFAQSDARAVLFQQEYGDLDPALSGKVTVGVANGEIAYVSSSLVKNTGDAPTAVLSPQAGWLKAATAIGTKWLGVAGPITADDITDTLTDKNADGWTRLEVAGFAQEQQARVRALALADGTVRPVIEANVVNVAGATTAAYTSLVDAVTGETLWRQSQVDQAIGGVPTGAGIVTGLGMPVLEDNPSKAQFQGEITATDCGPKHEFKITDDDTRQILASATTLNIADDIVLKLFGADGQLLTSGDTGTSPEIATASADPFPQGTYSVQVCPYADPTAPFTPPGNYVGNVAVSSSASGDVGLAYPPRWRYFDTNPSMSSIVPGKTPKNSVVGCWVTSTDQKPVRGCTEPKGPLANAAGRAPWDVNPNTELPSFTTLGNNASDREAWLSPLSPGGLFQAMFSPTREYTSRFTDAWNESGCDPTNFRPGGNDIDYATQNLFVSHNRIHDFSYFLGFKEKNYNLQVDNFGNRTDGARDPEIGNVQAGAADTQVFDQTGVATGRNNANQITLQDGVPGITNQYLFQPVAGAFYAPCADGGLDFGIVGHEYTHAISNRMIGGPDEGITSEQGGSMGEAWGDLVAAEFQLEHGYDNGGNTWAVGLYATGNKRVAIRDYAINHNPLNYGDFGFDSTGPEVHADGEIWNATMWRVRQALVDKYDKKGFEYGDKALQLRCSKGVPNLGPKQSYDCPGNRRWIQLMFDSFLLQQGATDMLQARDAFIAADQERYHGANRAIIWKAFAESGMGKGASTPDADSEDVTPSFAAPSGNRTVSFRPVLPNGKSVPGNVYIGDYEARVTPIADTRRDTKLGSGTEMTPGSYTGIFQSKQTGLTRFTLKVTSGGSTLTKRIPVRENLAGADNGAKVVDSSAGSLNVDALLDATEATNWGGVNAGGENVDEKNPFVTVDLAGGTQKVGRVVVSAYLHPADSSGDLPLLAGEAADPDPNSGSRFTALRKFAIEVCAGGCDSADSWKRVYTSPGNAFPGKRPRPVAPNLNFRTFSFDPVQAEQVRLVVLENQCTGYEGYTGEQDNDPTNPTDCKTGSDRGTIVHAAELEVFGR